MSLPTPPSARGKLTLSPSISRIPHSRVGSNPNFVHPAEVVGQERKQPSQPISRPVSESVDSDFDESDGTIAVDDEDENEDAKEKENENENEQVKHVKEEDVQLNVRIHSSRPTPSTSTHTPKTPSTSLDRKVIPLTPQNMASPKAKAKPFVSPSALSSDSETENDAKVHTRKKKKKQASPVSVSDSYVYRIVPETPLHLPTKIPWMTFQIAEFPPAYTRQLNKFKYAALILSFKLGAWFVWCCAQTNASFMIILTVLHGLCFLAMLVYFYRPFLKVWIQCRSFLSPLGEEEMEGPHAQSNERQQTVQNPEAETMEEDQDLEAGPPVFQFSQSPLDRLVDFELRSSKYFMNCICLLELFKIDTFLSTTVCIATTVIVLQPGGDEVVQFMSNLSSQSLALFLLAAFFGLFYCCILAMNTILNALCYGAVSPARSIQESRRHAELMRSMQASLDQASYYYKQLPPSTMQLDPLYSNKGYDPDTYVYQYGQLPGASTARLQQHIHHTRQQKRASIGMRETRVS